MSIGRIRALLYGAAKILGDVNALVRGRAGQRLARRLAGRLAARPLVPVTAQPGNEKAILKASIQTI